METGNLLKRIAIVGPECTGKSELANFLAQYYNTVWVPEFARSFLDVLNRPYQNADLKTIAKGQMLLEDSAKQSANKLLICDTTLLVVKVWSEFKYGYCDDEILNELSNRHYDLHLLTHIDIPWVEDPQREHPHQRQQLFSIYKAELEKMNTPFVEIKGERAQRRASAIAAIDKLFL
jgi:NadR type nicotinamide-nucleotide adenylyltransferase